MVAQHLDEQSLNTLTLTDKAIERLGIRTAPIVAETVVRRRTFGGEISLPPGQALVVSAPMAGTLSDPATGGIPRPGNQISAGQAVLSFTPLLTAERDVLTPSERIRVAQTRADLAAAQLDAQRQIDSATVAIDAAQIDHDRALELLKNRAGSQAAVDAAYARLRLAQESLETAQTRHKFLSEVELDEQAGEVLPRPINAPVSGVLQSISVTSGESVHAGAELFRVVRLDRVWIRVAVFVGERHDIAAGQSAEVREYGQDAGVEAVTAHPVAAPPSADAQAASLDLFYEAENAQGKFFPGQKVAVLVPLSVRAESLVVPWSAVIYDIHGGAWVYERLAQNVFARRRVEVDFIDAGRAVLAAGPAPRTEVVTDGSAELYGTEFGTGK
ncbi:MAG: efflux RND transporter periplasmic adaptor subunit [Pirellulales bacterium]|nr:efflux RND transporter periplasmic adaptor subunit [Pirellulales bacterium]